MSWGPEKPGGAAIAELVADGPRALATVHRSRAELKLDNSDLCFLVGLRVRAERSSLAAFDEETLVDVYEQVCDLTDPGAQNPRKRATHAIERFRLQRLLARVDGSGAMQAGEYSLTLLATAIVDFFLQDEALTKESLTLLTKILIASVGEVLAAARRAATDEVWRSEVVAPLRVTVSELVRGIERRQRGLDTQQEEIRKGIGGLLTQDWFAAVERCESLLEDTARTLAELNEVLLRDTSQLQALLQDIEQLASDKGAPAAVEACRRVYEHVEQVLAWGQARQHAWSDYYQSVQRYLREVVRLDPKRALSQRLRDQLVAWPDRRFSLVLASEERIRLLREVEPVEGTTGVTRPHGDRDVNVHEVPEDQSVQRLQKLVQQALARGAKTLSEVLEAVLPEFGEGEHYITTGRAAELVTAIVERSLERPWIRLEAAAFEVEQWQLSQDGRRK